MSEGPEPESRDLESRDLVSRDLVSRDLVSRDLESRDLVGSFDACFWGLLRCTVQGSRKYFSNQINVSAKTVCLSSKHLHSQTIRARKWKF